ncbi:MAG: ATP-binding protein [bacterium]|nr:ATP-binding protein [bacterium]
MRKLEVLSPGVDLSGLLEVLGNNLYSTPEVALRELIQNAHDSCVRRRIESAPENAGHRAERPPAPRIEISSDPLTTIVSIIDNGAGLTHDEIVRYLATIGAGYTRVLRRQSETADLIGAFGLGFLSAYVASKSVTVFTRSSRDGSRPLRFYSKDGQRYTIDDYTEQPLEIGTRVELKLKSELEYLAHGPNLEAIVRRYCLLLPLPVFVNDLHINELTPPWRNPDESLNPKTSDPFEFEEQAQAERPAPQQLRTKRQRLEFVRRVDARADPLCTMPVAETGNGRGLLWIHGEASFGSEDRRQLAVYVRGMLVCKNERDLLPYWAGYVGGVYESETLTPTASRESVQQDSEYLLAKAEIEESLIAGLIHVARTENEAWESILNRHNDALIGSALSGEVLFLCLRDHLRLHTSEGLMTVSAMLQRGDGRLHLSTGDFGGAEEIIARATGTPVADGRYYGTTAFLQRYAQSEKVELLTPGTETGNTRIFPEIPVSPEERTRIMALFRREDRKLLISCFEPRHLPLAIVPNREARLKRLIESDETKRRIASAALRLAKMHTARLDDAELETLIINMNSPLISELLAAPEHRAIPAARALAAFSEMIAVRSSANESTASLSDRLEELNAAFRALL